MTITRRLLIVLGLFLTILIGRTVFFDRSLQVLQSQILTLTDQTLVREELAEDMALATADVALATSYYATSRDPELIADLAQAGTEFQQALDAFTATATTRPMADAALTVARQFNDLNRQSGRIVAAADRRSGLEGEASAIEMAAADQTIDNYLARFHVLEDAISATLDHVITPATDSDVDRARTVISSEIEQTRLLSLGMGLAAGLLVLGAMWVIERRIAQPTRRLAAAAETLARGGTAPPPLLVAHDDELGRLTHVFNEMVHYQNDSRATLERVNQEMVVQNERLRELDRLKDHIVSTVSHELRTPLTSIIGYTELLLETSDGDLDTERAQFLQVVSRNAYRLQRMVDDLLLVAKIDAGTLRLEQAPFDLGTLLREAVETALPVAEDKGVKIVFEPMGSVPVVGDRTRLGQAIDNLLNNAIKFTPGRGTVELAGHCTDSSAKIVVTDSGMGIPPDELARVFDRFYRSSASGAVPGTGIGLSIVSYVAEAHGGSVAVQSQVGVGSTFTMTIPRQPDRTDPGQEVDQSSEPQYA